LMKSFLFSLIFIWLSFVNPKYVLLTYAEWGKSSAAQDSLNFGAEWIVNSLVEEHKVPKGDYYVSNITTVYKQELTHGADYQFNAQISSVQHAKIEGNFSVYYRYPPQPITLEEELIEFEECVYEEYEQEIEIGGEEVEYGPQKVVAYDYHYSYPLVNGEPIELQENIYIPVKFEVIVEVNEDDGESAIVGVSLVEQPVGEVEYPVENEEEEEEEGENNVEIVIGDQQEEQD